MNELTYDELINGGEKRYAPLTWALASGAHWKLIFAQYNEVPLDTEGNELYDGIAYAMESGVGLYPVNDDGDRCIITKPEHLPEKG